MTEKKYLSELITDEEVKQNPVTCVVAGLGSGKSTWVEGIHTTHKEVKGLVDRYNALYITSRRSKVEESHDNNPSLLKSIDSFFERKETLNQIESVACTFAHLIEYSKRTRNTNPYFWRAFDYIIVDEFHSIATDSNFTESFVVYAFLREVYEDCIAKKKNSDIRTRILLFSATPEPIPTLLKDLDAHIIDLSNKTRWIKPNSINIMPFIDILPKIQLHLEYGGRVIYYSTFFDKYNDLICTAHALGLNDRQIVVDISSSKQLEAIKEEHPLIICTTEKFREKLKTDKSIDEQVKLIITNSKNKEGINIYADVDFLVVENHYYTDIKQICGRLRNGGEDVCIVDDARQFDVDDKFENEVYLAKAVIVAFNIYIQFRVKKLSMNNVLLNDKLTEDIEQLLRFSKYIGFNYFNNRFELNTCLIDYRDDYIKSIKDYERRMEDEDLWMEIGEHDSYFNELIGYVKPRPVQYERTIEEDFELCCRMCECSVGTNLDYETIKNLGDMLNIYYNKRYKPKKFENLNSLFKVYGYKAITIGKHVCKEDRTYCIQKIKEKVA